MKTKVINVNGIDCCDIISYFSRILSCTGNKCLIVDSSENRDYMTYSGIGELDSSEIGKYGELTICNGVPNSVSILENYNYVILYRGDVAPTKKRGALDVVIVTPDKVRLDKYIDKISDNVFLIARNLPASSYDAHYICSILNLDSKNINLHEVGINEQDYKAYLDNQEATSIIMKRLSSDIRNMLNEFIRLVINEKDYKKLYRVASKGGKL